MNGGGSLASAAHMGHEFIGEEEAALVSLENCCLRADIPSFKSQWIKRG